MLNHTTLLFAPNLPGIKWNVNKFALIIAQKSPDNHTYLFLFSTFTALIHQHLADGKYCLWFLSYRDHLSQSSDYGLQRNWPNLTCLIIHPNFVTNGKVMKHEYFPLSVLIYRFSFHIKLLIPLKVNAAAISLSKEVILYNPWGFPSPHHWWPYLDNHTAPLFAQFLPVKNGNY